MSFPTLFARAPAPAPLLFPFEVTVQVGDGAMHTFDVMASDIEDAIDKAWDAAYAQTDSRSDLTLACTEAAYTLRTTKVPLPPECTMWERMGRI